MCSLVFWLKHPSPPCHAQHAVQAMLALWHSYLLDLHGMSLSQEHLIIFNVSSGARATLSTTVALVFLSIRVWGDPFSGGFSCNDCLHMATCSCDMATFSLNASFVGGRFCSFGSAPILHDTFVDHIFCRAAVIESHEWDNMNGVACRSTSGREVVMSQTFAREWVRPQNLQSLPFPIPWYIAVSHPVRPWTARICPMIARLLSTLALLSMTVLPLIRDIIMICPVISPWNTKTNTSVSLATTRTWAAPNRSHLLADHCICFLMCNGHLNSSGNCTLTDLYRDWIITSDNEFPFQHILMRHKVSHDQFDQLFLVVAHCESYFLWWQLITNLSNTSYTSLDSMWPWMWRRKLLGKSCTVPPVGHDTTHITAQSAHPSNNDASTCACRPATSGAQLFQDHDHHEYQMAVPISLPVNG